MKNYMDILSGENQPHYTTPIYMALVLTIMSNPNQEGNLTEMIYLSLASVISYAEPGLEETFLIKLFVFSDEKSLCKYELLIGDVKYWGLKKLYTHNCNHGLILFQRKNLPEV